MAFPDFESEQERIERLHELRILDTPPEPDYDELTRLIAQICRTPIALVTLVDEDRQWFKSNIGLAATETPRALTFCAHTIREKRLVVVPDAARDRRFSDSPLVAGEPFIRFYAGAPLITEDGLALGTLNVMDTVARRLSPQQEEALVILAGQAARLLKMRGQSIALARLNRELRASEENYRLIAESASDMIVAIDESGVVLFANPASESVLGYRPEELVGRSVEKIIPEHLRKAHARAFRRYRETGRKTVPANRFETFAVQSDGRQTPVEVSFGECTWAGRPGYTAVIRDVSQRRTDDEALKQSEQYHRSLFQLANDAILLFDPRRQTIFDVNERACQIYGIPRSEFIGKNLRELTSDPAGTARFLNDVVRRGFYEEHETVHLRADGTPIDFLINASIVNYQGRPAVLSINRDITQLKAAEIALVESQRMLQLVMDSIPQAIYWKDLDLVYLGCNRAFSQFADLSSPSEIVGKTDYDFPIDPAKIELFRADDRRVLETGTAKYHIMESLVLPDGTTKWLEVNKIPLRNARDEIIGLLGTFEDVSYRKEAEAERRHLEEQLRHSQRMESIGTLAGGIAHDFNNLLTIILGNLQLARRKLENDSPLQGRLSDIEGAAARAAALTEQLLTFSRRQRLERKNVNLDEVMKNVLKMLRRIIGEDIAVEFYPSKNLKMIYADPAQLEQIIMNLAINARDAMPDGGRLIIETENVRLDEAYQRSHAETEPGEYVRLMVSDTGMGMTDEVQRRVFEPFFTTKEVGRGTGLGLSMVYGIVRQHGGNIEVYSERERGTTFKIYFPVAEAPAETELGGERRDLEGGTETILVAEDETALRELIREILRELGYRVILARDGAELVEKFERVGDEVDLVMIDLVMPRLGGTRAYDIIRAANSDIPVIFMTGHSDKIAGDLPAELIRKPYQFETLARKVREVLDGRGPRF